MRFDISEAFCRQCSAGPGRDSSSAIRARWCMSWAARAEKSTASGGMGWSKRGELSCVDSMWRLWESVSVDHASRWSALVSRWSRSHCR